MKVVNRQPLYDGHYKLYRVTLEHEGITFDREIFRTGVAVAGLVYHTSKKKFIFVKQYRAGVGEEVTEMVAGIHDQEGQTQEEGLRREIKEEIGYTTDRLELICPMYPSPGAMEEICHLYFAEVSRQESKGGGKDEENENIRIVELAPEELDQHEWRDAKTLIALQWLKLSGKLQTFST